MFTPWAVFHESFEDMDRQLDRVPVPEDLTFLESKRRGGNPPFFGDYPTINRFYTTTQSIEAVCVELKRAGERAAEFVSSNLMLESCFCSHTFKLSSGLIARMWGHSSYVLFLYGQARGEAASCSSDTKIQFSVVEH
jgi:hypothetical protein